MTPEPEPMPPAVDTSTQPDDGPQPDQEPGYVEVEVADEDTVEVDE